MTVNQSTITENTAIAGSAGIHTVLTNSSSNTISLFNSILAANSGAPDGNISYSSTGTFTLNVTRSLFGDNLMEINGTNDGAYPSNTPYLGSLQSNGGSTPTMRPDSLSPAVDSGNSALVVDLNDQRGSGFARIQGSSVDMGSVERQTIINGGLNEVIKRGEMARALLEAIGETPPLFATGLEYHDVQAMDSNANWISHFKAEGYTEGCDTNKFCPNMVVSREEMTKIFIKVQELNGNFNPPIATSATYNDVPLGHPLIDWVEDLENRGVTNGCDANNFCPDEPVTRKWFDEILGQF